MTIDEQIQEKAVICIQSYIRGYIQRYHFRRLINKPQTSEVAAIIIQKCYRGFRFRKAYFHYKQRISTQMLCFLQQIELINNDFYIKVVRTNYCVPFKSIELTTNNKQANKFIQHFFPPPPPLSSSSLLDSFRIPIPVSSIPPPLSPSISKFAQVRDMFTRAGPAITPLHHIPPIKPHTPPVVTSLHTIPAIEQSRSPQSVIVLNAVQEYQRQHINIHQPAYKRFAHLNLGSVSNANRSPNIGGGSRPRSVGQFSFTNNKLQNKQMQPVYGTSSPKQQPKPITRVI
jgi:hypothetical protein